MPLGTEFVVGGYFDPGDGGGGTFIWIPGAPITNEDLGITFNAPNDATGYFQRVYSGPINVRWFGAILGATDPTPPIDPFTGFPLSQPIADVTVYVHRARDSKDFADNGSLYFPKGVYCTNPLITGQIFQNS